MATNKQIIEALRGVRSSLPTSAGYATLHTKLCGICRDGFSISSDIKEISAVIRNGNGNNK
jgi:hypothetical protein